MYMVSAAIEHSSKGSEVRQGLDENRTSKVDPSLAVLNAWDVTTTYSGRLLVTLPIELLDNPFNFGSIEAIEGLVFEEEKRALLKVCCKGLGWGDTADIGAITDSISQLRQHVDVIIVNDEAIDCAHTKQVILEAVI